MSLTFWDLLFQKPSQEEVEKFKEYILEKFDDNSDGKISMCEVRTIQWLSLISKGFVVCFGLLGRRDGFLSYSSHLIYPLRASWHIRPSRSPSIYLNYPQRSSLPPTIAILLLLFPFQPFDPQVVFDLPILLFPSGAQVISMLQSSFWSCLSVIIFHHLPSTLLNLFTHRFNVCSF